MPRRILVVDDSRTTLQVVQVHLMGQGFEFDLAADAEQALQLMDAQSPHLVISDLNMPGMSGIDLCRRVRKSFMHRKTPFVVVTSSKEDASRRDAFAAGADGYLTKPVDPARLLAMVRRLLQRRDEAESRPFTRG